MRHLSILVACVFALPAVANPLAIDAPSAVVAPSSLTSWARAQVTRGDVSAHEVQVDRFGSSSIIRVQPAWQGIPVIGADSLWRRSADGQTTAVRSTALTAPVPFHVEAHQAIVAAFAAIPYPIVRDATVENVSGMAVARYLQRNGTMTPVWIVRAVSWQAQQSRDVTVSAVDGTILATKPLLQNGGPIPVTEAKANVFDNGPNPAGVDEADVITVDLGDLAPLIRGDHLTGNHFQTFNCCKFHVCLDNSTDCLANLETGVSPISVARCADQADIDDGIAVETFLQPPGIPLSALPIPQDLPIDLPDPIFLKVAFCAELPSLTATEVDGELGFFADPIDADRAAASPACGQPGSDARGCAAEVDGFAEAHAYHETQRFFAHLRTVLEDDTFCLAGDSMRCNADGTPVLTEEGRPEYPFHIGTNVLFPEFDIQALGIQVFQGRGENAGNPVIIDDFQRIPNAAFIPALSGGGITLPPGTEALAQLFYRPFDSNVYFQGPRDFAYDGDIVRHEFTHAVVHHYVPNLASLGKDDQGSHAMSGALNEGWSDYFSSSFINNGLVGDYAGQGLTGSETAVRDNNNDFKCPDAIWGQVHADSEPWAGALWEMRALLLANGTAAPAIDRVVLEALAQADDDEDYIKATTRLRAGIVAAFGEDTAVTIDPILASRGLSSCERVWPLSTVAADGRFTVARKDLFSLPDPQSIGLTNFSPPPVQLQVQVPAGSAGFTLKWAQGSGGFFGQSGGEQPPAVLVTEGSDRLTWSYEGNQESLAVPVGSDGNEVEFNEAEKLATVVAGANGAPSLASYTHVLVTDACANRTFIVNIVGFENATLQSIEVENLSSDAVCGGEGEGEGEGEDPGVSGAGCCGGSPASAVLGLVGLATLRRRRRRN